MVQQKTYKLLSIFLPLQCFVYWLFSQQPEWVESFFSNGSYRLSSSASHLLLGWLPFSLGDLLYTWAAILFLRGCYQCWSGHLRPVEALYKFTGIASVVYCLFHLSWGLNYHRLPLTEKLSLNKEPLTVSALLGLTEPLITEVNRLQRALSEVDTLETPCAMSKADMMEQAVSSYASLSEKHPQFSYPYPSLKGSLYSLPLSYMGFAGYLNPFTNEAQVNMLIPNTSFPVTACHEIAHQLGVASESEANFVGYLASINARNQYLNYTGYLMALRYCLNDLYRIDRNKYKDLLLTINKGTHKDLLAIRDFWKSHRHWSEKYIKSFYDLFLKANKQPDGIKSYRKVVGMMIHYHKKHPIIHH